MSAWSTVEQISEWAREHSSSGVEFDRNSTRVFHEVYIHGQLVLQWQRESSGRDLLIRELSQQEEYFLRQRFSGAATISRPAKPAGAATLSLRSQAELEAVIEVLHARLRKEPLPSTTDFSGSWGTFTYWARRFHEWNEFDQHERDYKLKIASNLQAARLALESGDPDWFTKLKRAFSSPNNLTNWRMHSVFLAWCQQHPADAQAALNLIWEPAEPRRIRSFLRAIPPSVVGGSGLRLSLASFLQMALDPLDWPFYRATLFSAGFELTGFAPPPPASDEQGTYDHATHFLDQVRAEAAARGLELRDRLDAQSVLWTVCVWDAVEEWSREDKAAFYAFRGQQQPAEDVT